MCHLPALMYGAAMACALWKNGCASFARLGGDFRRQPKVAVFLRYVDVRIWKDALPVLSGEAADVIGVKVRDQNEVDFFRRVACAAETARQAPERSPAKPGAGACVDEDQLLASIDQEAGVGDIQYVRIFVQRLDDTIDRRLSLAASADRMKRSHPTAPSLQDRPTWTR